jgi:hypothetical protein
MLSFRMANEVLTVSELLDLVEETYGSWMQLLESAPVDKFEDPGVSGTWSLKDIIAHITWHEEQMAGVLQTRTLIGSEWWNLPTAERNAAIFEEFKAASLDQVMARAEAVHQQLVHWIKTLSDDELNEPGQFEAMPENWVFGDVLAENTFEHYGDHAAAVARWLADQPKRA